MHGYPTPSTGDCVLNGKTATCYLTECCHWSDSSEPPLSTKTSAPPLPAQPPSKPTPWQPWPASQGEPNLFLSLLKFPHPPQASKGFDVRVAAWQGQEDKTPFVPSLHNETFGSLGEHRDKRLGFFPSFSLFFNNKWWFVSASSSFRATPASKSMKSAETQGKES